MEVLRSVTTTAVFQHLSINILHQLDLPAFLGFVLLIDIDDVDPVFRAGTYVAGELDSYGGFW